MAKINKFHFINYQGLESVPVPTYTGTVSDYLKEMQEYLNIVSPGIKVPTPPNGSGNIVITAPSVPVAKKP